MNNIELKFKQLFEGGNIEGYGFYAKFGRFPSIDINTQSSGTIIRELENNAGNWVQRNETLLPTYRNGRNAKIEIPLDLLAQNANMQNIVLYVNFAGTMQPYAISDKLPALVKSKFVDILSVYLELPTGHNIKGKNSNQIQTPNGLTGYTSVPEQGSWVSKLFYEEMRDSIPLALPIGKNGIFYDDNGRINDLRSPTGGRGGGGGLNIEGGTDITLTDEYKLNVRNTPAGDGNVGLSEKGTQKMYNEAIISEGKHWKNLEPGGSDNTTTTWDEISPKWPNLNKTHLQVLNKGENKLAPESLADFFKRMSELILKEEQGIFHIIKPITKGDLKGCVDNIFFKKTFNFKKKAFYPNMPGNVSTFVDDIDFENIYLPLDIDSNINGSSVVSASLTLLNHAKMLQNIESDVVVRYNQGVARGNGHLASLTLNWNKDVLDINIQELYSDPNTPIPEPHSWEHFPLPFFRDGIYNTFGDSSVIGYLTLHVAKRFFFLSSNSPYNSFQKPSINTSVFNVNVIDKEIEESPGERQAMGGKTPLPVIVELVKLSTPSNFDKDHADGNQFNGNVTSVFFFHHTNLGELNAEGSLNYLVKERITRFIPGYGGRANKTQEEDTWSPYEVGKNFYGVRVYIKEDLINSNKITVQTIQNTYLNARGRNDSGKNFGTTTISHVFDRTNNIAKPDQQSVDGYKLLTSDKYPTGIFTIGIPAHLEKNNIVDYSRSNEPHYTVNEVRLRRDFVTVGIDNNVYPFKINIIEGLPYGANVANVEDRDSDDGYVYRDQIITMGTGASGNPDLSKLQFSPKPPDTPKIRRRIQEKKFEGQFRLNYGSCIEIHRQNQITINNEVVGSIPANTKNGETFSITEMVNNYASTHSGNLNIKIGISGDTIFGNTLEGDTFSREINLS